MVAPPMLTPLLVMLVAASAPADAPSALPDTAGRGPYLRSPPEIEFAAPRDGFPDLPPVPAWWAAKRAPDPGAFLRLPEPAGRDSLLAALLLARCGREGDPALMWREVPGLGWRLRLARLEASWLPPAVRRILLGQALADRHRRLKSREAEMYGEFLATEIPVTDIPDTAR